MDRTRTHASLVGLIVIAALALVAGAGRVAAQDQATPAPETSAEVVREVLSPGSPAGAPGQVLQLVRYTIPPGAQLPAHTHPGMQAAWVVSGTLSYTVVEGAVPLYRAATDGTSGAEAIEPADGEVAILPGDAFVEPAGVVHFGRNAGEEPVVILVASLFAEGVPPATILEASPAATPAG
jgi:quercetin dioxygenase-like cupin family protein